MSSAIAPAASQPSRIEFDHDSGSVSVHDATYLVVLFRRSV
ncbi:MAG: hypothetical protein WB761_05195 [Solirubrobacteraceae bacterium]